MIEISCIMGRDGCNKNNKHGLVYHSGRLPKLCLLASGHSFRTSYRRPKQLGTWGPLSHVALFSILVAYLFLICTVILLWTILSCYFHKFTWALIFSSLDKAPGNIWLNAHHQYYWKFFFGATKSSKGYSELISVAKGCRPYAVFVRGYHIMLGENMDIINTT